MMRIPLTDARVNQAIKTLKEEHNEFNPIKFAELFEEIYRCKIVTDPEDTFCINGWMEIPEDKYATWFVLKFGDTIE